MTPDEIKSAITGWCEQGTTLQLVEDRSEPGAVFVLGLRSGGHSATGTVPLTVRLDEGSDHVTVTSTSPPDRVPQPPPPADGPAATTGTGAARPDQPGPAAAVEPEPEPVSSWA